MTEPIRERYPLAKELYKRCCEGESALEPLIEYGMDVVAPEIAQVQALQPDGAGMTAEAVLKPLIDLARQRWDKMPAGQIILLVLVFSDGATFFGEKPQFARSGFGIAYCTPGGPEVYGHHERRTQGPLPGLLQENNRAELYAIIIVVVQAGYYNLHVKSDSQNTIRGINRIIAAHPDKTAMQATIGVEAANHDLWTLCVEILHSYLMRFTLLVEYVPAHLERWQIGIDISAADFAGNERADTEAKEGARKHATFKLLETALKRMDKYQAAVDQLQDMLVAINLERQRLMEPLGTFSHRLQRQHYQRRGEFPFEWRPDDNLLERRTIPDREISKYISLPESVPYCLALRDYLRRAQWLKRADAPQADHEIADYGITFVELMVDVAFTTGAIPLALADHTVEALATRFKVYLRHLNAQGYGTDTQSELYPGAIDVKASATFAKLGLRAGHRAAGLTSRPVFQHKQTAIFLRRIQLHFATMRLEQGSKWMRTYNGLHEQFKAHVPLPRVPTIDVNASDEPLLPDDARAQPPGGGYCSCPLAIKAFPQPSEEEIRILPLAERLAAQARKEAAVTNANKYLTTREGRQEIVDQWRNTFQDDPVRHVEQRGHRVRLNCMKVGQYTFVSGNLKAIADVQDLRTRVVDAFEAGWSLTSIQEDVTRRSPGQQGSREHTKTQCDQIKQDIKQQLNQLRAPMRTRVAANRPSLSQQDADRPAQAKARRASAPARPQAEPKSPGAEKQLPQIARARRRTSVGLRRQPDDLQLKHQQAEDRCAPDPPRQPSGEECNDMRPLPRKHIEEPPKPHVLRERQATVPRVEPGRAKQPQEDAEMKLMARPGRAKQPQGGAERKSRQAIEAVPPAKPGRAKQPQDKAEVILPAQPGRARQPQDDANHNLQPILAGNRPEGSRRASSPQQKPGRAFEPQANIENQPEPQTLVSYFSQPEPEQRSMARPDGRNKPHHGQPYSVPRGGLFGTQMPVLAHRQQADEDYLFSTEDLLPRTRQTRTRKSDEQIAPIDQSNFQIFNYGAERRANSPLEPCEVRQAQQQPEEAVLPLLAPVGLEKSVQLEQLTARVIARVVEPDPLPDQPQLIMPGADASLHEISSARHSPAQPDRSREACDREKGASNLSATRPESHKVAKAVGKQRRPAQKCQGLKNLESRL